VATEGLSRIVTENYDCSTAVTEATALVSAVAWHCLRHRYFHTHRAQRLNPVAYFTAGKALFGRPEFELNLYGAV
jgi:hypothetical protein